MLRSMVRLVGAAGRLLTLGAWALLLHAQSTLQITSPAAGTVVAPGQTISVSVTPSSSNAFSRIAVIGDIGFGAFLNAPPYQFSMQIPAKAGLHIHMLTAWGLTAPGVDPIYSLSVPIDVERPDSPVNVTVDDSLVFSASGHKLPLVVFGTFSDGSKYDLSRSTKTTYVSDTPSVATVSNAGLVTAVSPGKAHIVVNGSIFVSVTVPPPITVMPAAKRLYASQSQQFTARAGYAGTVSVTWSLNPPGAGSIDSTGLYTAPASITSRQNVTIIARSTLDSMRGATATVMLNPPILAAVTPAATVSASRTRQFAATLSNSVDNAQHFRDLGWRSSVWL
jgi:hypothetical protein